ncbi:MAG: VWA domain-containing protein [Planctomycetes bacterium]|nr:VWA domain-containing protein [Planctomycetota bacterium]
MTAKLSFFAALYLATSTVLSSAAPQEVAPDLRRLPPHRGPVFLEKEQVRVEIREGLATTNVSQTYRSASQLQEEHTFLFPLPADAAVTNFQLTMNGKPVAGEVLDTQRAREIYEGIVRAARDPGLLELVGTQLLRARIFPVPPQGTMEIGLAYSAPCGLLGGIRTYTYPLRRQALLSRPVQSLVVSAEIHARGGLKAIFSPTHAIDVVRQSDVAAKASFEIGQVVPDRDFDLYYSEQSGLLGLTALCDKSGTKDGTFALFLAPAFAAEGRAEPKDVAFVFDTSGSMAGPKMEQARTALKTCLERLGPEDRFVLIPFSTEARPHAGALVANDAAAKAQALQVIAELQARGGTNIDEALAAALSLRPADTKRPYQVLFLTDGLPTVGVTDGAAIASAMRQRNKAGTRIFAFGVGDDVNTQLLDTLAQETRASREYVRPHEDLELKVTALFDRVASPVATQLALSFDALETYDVYPRALPDLFFGSQLLVVGRYKQGGHKAVRLKGLVRGEPKEWVFEAEFPAEEQARPEITDWWASQKIGYLLDQLRLQGQNQELIDEVVRLGKEHGIVTPYTSFLVVEETERLARARGVPARRWSEGDDGFFRRGGIGAVPVGDPAPGAAAAPADALRELEAKELAKSAESSQRIASLSSRVAGAEAVEESLDLGRLRDGQGLAGGRGRSKNGADNPFVRRIEGRVFHLIDGVWTESSFKAEDRAQLRKVAFLSEEYFALLKSDPKVARILALGPRVVLKIGANFTEIAEG